MTGLSNEPSLDFVSGASSKAGGRRAPPKAQSKSNVDFTVTVPHGKDDEDGAFNKRPDRGVVVNNQLSPKGKDVGGVILKQGMFESSQGAAKSKPRSKPKPKAQSKSKQTKGRLRPTTVKSRSRGQSNAAEGAIEKKNEDEDEEVTEATAAAAAAGVGRSIAEAGRASASRGRVSPQKRMQLKNTGALKSLRSRERPDVKARIRQMDQQSHTRWNVSSKLEYEENLSQGLDVVSRSDKIDWIWPKPPQSKEDEAAALEEAEQADLQRKLRRARCSTACKTLFPQADHALGVQSP